MKIRVYIVIVFLWVCSDALPQGTGHDEQCAGDLVSNQIRFSHCSDGIAYYSVRLTYFASMYQRGYFYELTRTHHLNIADKADLEKDSALFTSHYTDTLTAYHLLKDLQERTMQEAQIPEPEPQPDAPSAESTLCEDAEVACSENTYHFESGTTGNATPPVAGYPNYGCLGSQPAPAWFYMQIGQAGNIIISISQENAAGQGKDVDFICWGPFTSLSEGCATGLTGECGQLPPKPICCTNTSPFCAHFYPSGNMVDCSFDPAPQEVCTIPFGQVGEIYILLITNFSRQPAWVTFSQTGGTGLTNCNIVVNCGIVAFNATPTACDIGTNTFSVSGLVEFSNPPATGTLVVSDVSANPQVTQTFSAPFISPVSYNLTQIPCDGLNHTLQVGFSDSTSCLGGTTVSAPPAACPTAAISGGGSLCATGSGTVAVSISLGGPGPYNFTWSVDGVPQAPVTSYSGPSPYVLNTSVPGTYTLVSVSNAVCTGPGIISGSAVVISIPGPVPAITGTDTVCIGAIGVSYATETGKSGYLWGVSSGGTITSGQGTENITVTWNSSGNQSVNVFYADPQGCEAAAPTIFPVTVHPPPYISFRTCFDTLTTTNARPFLLKGGIPEGGTYSGTGVTATGYFSPWLSGAGVRTITYSCTDVNSCMASATARIHVFAPAGFFCGNNFTDIRDGKSYPTIQIGSQCWMATNLNYGDRINSNQFQSDNCISEKHCHGDNNANCTTRGGLYQWDELMRYSETALQQGLCPPAWHVPAQAEWMALFSTYLNNAFAASYLKATGFSGFDAILPGVYHQTIPLVDYPDFATFFWTADSHGVYKAWAHGMNSYDPSVSVYPSSRSNAFSVRCIKD